jgi:hypothetical protein
MNTKTSFQYKISNDAYDIMKKILRNPDVTGPEINGAVCRITSTHDVLLSIQTIYLQEYKDDELVSVRLQNNDTRQFAVMKSLMKKVDDSLF